MNHGLNITFDTLAKTPNEAAVAVLVPALDSADAEVRSKALVALLKRSSLGGHREILRRGHILGKSLQGMFSKTPGKMQPALREAVLGTNRQMCFNACQAILWSREYDLFPVLLTLLEAPEHPHADLGRKTVLQLAELLLEELFGPRINARRRDPQIIRRHAIACLEKSLFSFSQRQTWEVVEAYLTLAQRDDAGLRTILLDPQHSCFTSISEVLLRSTRHGVARLLASFLDDPNPPMATLQILTQRSDAEFVDILLKRIGESLSGCTAENLRRLDSIAWADPAVGVVESLDSAAQRRALHFLMASGLVDAAKFQMVKHLFLHGKEDARKEAVKALSGFKSSEANDLLLLAASDDDPLVQAKALGHLRDRGIPGSISLLFDRIHSPHEVVREAVRDALSEFRFDRFVTSFETLSEEVRRSTGQLVKQIDAETIPKLKTELASPSRLRRIRAIELIAAMDAVSELENELIERLDDEDYLVRVEATRTLAESNSALMHAALSNDADEIEVDGLSAHGSDASELVLVQGVTAEVRQRLLAVASANKDTAISVQDGDAALPAGGPSHTSAVKTPDQGQNTEGAQP